MRQLGFNLLVRLSETPAELPRSGIVVTRAWLEKHPNTALALVAANLDAQQRMYTETDKAVASLAAWTQTSSADAEKLLTQQLTVLRRDMRWTQAAWEAQRNVQTKVDQAMRDMDVTKAYTFEVLNKLRDIGFNDAVGLPKT